MDLQVGRLLLLLLLPICGAEHGNVRRPHGKAAAFNIVRIIGY